MQRFRHVLAALAFATLGVSQASAIPAYPGKMTARQADGTTITIQRLGDEHCHTVVTSDGYPLTFNAQSGNFEYATTQGAASGIVAQEPAQRSLQARQFLAGVDRQQFMQAYEARYAAAFEKANAPYYNKAKQVAGGPRKGIRFNDVPAIGKRKGLVILVQFSNRSFSMNDPVSYYDDFFHGDNFTQNGAQGSARQFYREGSCYRYDPDFDIFGPVTVSQTTGYYAGSDGTSETYKLIPEAVRLVKSAYPGVDFSQYDTDGDGTVDNVYILYAGYGQADSYQSDAIWPHSYNLSYSGTQFQMDGVTIDRYACSQELNGQSRRPVGIGTFVHEFGHVLGLADHYNTGSEYTGNGSYATNQPGRWDLMAAGSYNNNQNTPAPFSAFERESLGWMEYTELPADSAAVLGLPAFMDSCKAFRVRVPNNEREYFVIENRQQKGWDTYLPGHGLLVWHIDEDERTWAANAPNADKNHQRVDIVEADGRTSSEGKDSDCFPGSMQVDHFDFTSWNRRNVFGFQWLDETVGDSAHFLLTNTDYRLPESTVSVSNVKGTSATLTWTRADMATGYNVLVVRNGEVVASTTAEAPGSFEATGLEPETTYDAVVISTLGTLRSDSARQSFTTAERQIEETKVVALDAANVSAQSFTARWQAVRHADRYEVTLYDRERTGITEYGTGFAGYTQARPVLPEGWYTNRDLGVSNQQGAETSSQKASIRLNRAGDCLVASCPNEQVQGVRFWYRSNRAGTQLLIDQAIGGKWSNAKTITIDATTTSQDFTDSIAINGADSVRFQLAYGEGQTSGYFLLDDVYLSYLRDKFTPLRTVSQTGAAASAGETLTYDFTSLDATKKYGYSVVAFYGSRESQVSDTIAVGEVSTGIGQLAIPATGQAGDSVVFDLQGRRVATLQADGRLPATLPRGIYIVRGKKVVVN